MSKAVAAVEQQIFVKREHELAGLYKNLSKTTPQAVVLLEEIMNNDKLPLRERKEAAAKLIDLQVKVSEVISKDSLMRQVAEIKVKGLSVPLDATGQPKRQAPSIDFNNLQEV